jgi:predicted nucleic acid-binding protein
VIVLDTDALSHFLRQRDPWRERVTHEISHGTAATTSINAYELWSWRLSKRAEAQVHSLLDELTIFEVDAAAARRASDLRRQLERDGSPLATPDLLIAGVCLARGLPLLTGNTRHFSRVPGLALADLKS